MYKSISKYNPILFSSNNRDKFKYWSSFKMQNEIIKLLNKELYLYKKRHHNKSVYYSNIRHIENKYLEVLNDFNMGKKYTFKYL